MRLRLVSARQLCAIAAFFLIACSRKAAISCLPTGVSYDSAKRAYQARDYARASRAFETLALATQGCARDRPLDPNRKQFVAYEMLTAAEAAHWDRHDARARLLAKRARALIVMFEGEASVKRDEDAEFGLSGDKQQADRDLAGMWTIGLRP